MKKAAFVWVLFVLAGSLLSAQDYYTGGAMPQGYTPDRQMVHQVLTPPQEGEFYLGFEPPDNYVQGPLHPANANRDVFICPDCAIQEGEADIEDGGIDITNGGCNFQPYLYSYIQFGQVICGRGNGYINSDGGSSRDTDWYEFTLTQTTTVYLSGLSNFNAVIYLLPAGCPGSVTASGSLIPGIPATTSATFDAGVYIAFVAPAGFGTNPLLDGDYMITLTTWPVGSPDTWCWNPGDCISCGIQEGEPPNVDNIGDLTNYGCNGDEFEPDRPPIFSPIEIGDVICGTGDHFTYGASTFRDTDWYRLVLTSAKTLYWSVTADFDMAMIIIQGPCDAQVYHGYGVVPAFGVNTISATLGPGEYYFWAGPSDWDPQNNGSYMATLTEFPPFHPAYWCKRQMVPLADWALFVGIGLILLATIVRFRKMI